MTDRQQLIVNNVDTVKQLILDAERWIWLIRRPVTPSGRPTTISQRNTRHLDTHSSKPETFRAFTPMLRQENRDQR